MYSEVNTNDGIRTHFTLKVNIHFLGLLNMAHRLKPLEWLTSDGLFLLVDSSIRLTS